MLRDMFCSFVSEMLREITMAFEILFRNTVAILRDIVSEHCSYTSRPMFLSLSEIFPDCLDGIST